MVDSADHITGKTGLSPTVKISKAGAAGAGPSGAVSEVDSTNAPGWYKVAGNATDTATLGPLILHATAAGADPVDVLYEVVAVDPQAVDYGVGSMPIESGVTLKQATAAIAAACAGVLSGAGTGTITIKNINGSTTRITATTDASGNRSAITLSLP